MNGVSARKRVLAIRVRVISGHLWSVEILVVVVQTADLIFVLYYLYY